VRFNQKMGFSLVLPLGMLLIAVLVSLWGQAQTQQHFARYIAVEQTVADRLQDMYTQGLQMGQALRNLALTPTDASAQTNLDKARKDYQTAFEEAVHAASAQPDLAHGLEALPALRSAHAAQQEQVLNLIRQSDPRAAEVLRTQETPAWRALRQALLAQIKTVEARADAEVQATHVLANQMQWLALILAGLAVGVGVGVVSFAWLQRTLHRELGLDPADAQQALSAMASGDLAHPLPPSDPQADRSLLSALAHMQARLSGMVRDVSDASSQILLASGEVALGIQDLSVRTEAAASNLQETASSMGQLTDRAHQSADAAGQADAMAHEAAKAAEQGGDVVKKVVGTMEAISHSSQKIADIIGVIDGIAFQTNILALNAAVEAARAGEQGRGFAVVAGEVRNLAQRSAQAAQEIKQLIHTSTHTVQAGNVLVTDAGATMAEVVRRVQAVAAVLHGITESSEEGRGSIGQVNSAVSALDQMTQQNAALVEEGAAAAHALNDQASRLSGLVGAFRLA
jgi:methyl-accepting chemotaxis protein